MFTGLVEEVGVVRWLKRTTEGTELQIEAAGLTGSLRKGDSLAINGCCLTAVTLRKELVTFDLLQETLDRTNLGALRPESRVNLERPLAADGRLGGHFVQGHIDTTAKILAIQKRGADHRVEVELAPEYAHLVVQKGSIAIDGISLTVAEAAKSSFSVWIIPHTWEVTNLRGRKAGEKVNLEFDILAKYLERMREVARF